MDQCGSDPYIAWKVLFNYFTYNCLFLLLENPCWHKISIIQKYPAVLPTVSQNAEGCEIWALGRRNRRKRLSLVGNGVMVLKEASRIFRKPRFGSIRSVRIIMQL
jgi:hypothetical protein